MESCKLLILIFSISFQMVSCKLMQDQNKVSLLSKKESQGDFSFLVSLKYIFREETFMELFTKLALSEMSCPIESCNITLNNITEAIRLDRFSTEDLAEAIGKLNLKQNDVYNMKLLYNITVNTTQKFLATFDLTVSEIYNNLVNLVTTPGKTIPEALIALNVSVVDFMKAQAYGNDSIRLQVLSTGNYTPQTFQSVLNITNKTAIDLLKTFPLNKMVTKLGSLDAVDFVNFVKNLGVTSSILIKFYEYLNVTAIDFLTYPRFIPIVTQMYYTLNEEELLGVMTSNINIITASNTKMLSIYRNPQNELTKTYASLYAEIIENPILQYPVKSINFNTVYKSKDIAIVESKTTFSENYLTIAKDFKNTTLHNCTYVSKFPFGGLYIQNISSIQANVSKIVMPKDNETIYYPGSPIYCKNKLYGIATQDEFKNIIFSTFSTINSSTLQPPVKFPEVVTSTTKPSNVTQNKPNISLRYISNIYYIFLLASIAILQ